MNKTYLKDVFLKNAFFFFLRVQEFSLCGSLHLYKIVITFFRWMKALKT